ncbi:hypothetical protein LOAG_10676 [Loa loa]|uniref:Uncharacterized protein n=1 Tax=Loa loa TaxID=7209 RepID=A0A1S0TPD1_LOALO|nr:hypothetical protein LOAG_10676 [Loa loa]EFO17821.1 hypothetical protein LOAG_10676 [Loa loa]
MNDIGNIKKKESEQPKRIPELLSQQIAPLNKSNCKCSVKKAIIRNELPELVPERFHSSNKKNLQATKNEKTKFFHLEEQMKQSINSDDSNENGTVISALMVDNITVFPRQLKWKLVNTVQQIQLKNPTENRFAIKFTVLCKIHELFKGLAENNNREGQGQRSNKAFNKYSK